MVFIVAPSGKGETAGCFDKAGRVSRSDLAGIPTVARNEALPAGKTPLLSPSPQQLAQRKAKAAEAQRKAKAAQASTPAPARTGGLRAGRKGSGGRTELHPIAEFDEGQEPEQEPTTDNKEQLFALDAGVGELEALISDLRHRIIRLTSDSQDEGPGITECESRSAGEEEDGGAAAASMANTKWTTVPRSSLRSFNEAPTRTLIIQQSSAAAFHVRTPIQIVPAPALAGPIAALGGKPLRGPTCSRGPLRPVVCAEDSSAALQAGVLA